MGLAKGEFVAWSIQVTYQWVQKFPAKSILHVTHRYKPFVAEGSTGGYDSIRTVSRFCMNQKVKNKLDALASDVKHLDGYNQLSGTIVN